MYVCIHIYIYIYTYHKQNKAVRRQKEQHKTAHCNHAGSSAHWRGAANSGAGLRSPAAGPCAASGRVTLKEHIEKL